MHLNGKYNKPGKIFAINFLNIFSFLLFIPFLYSQDNSDCLMCHEDKTLTGTRNGKTISVFVNEKKLSSSVHSGIDCISCHVDLEGSDFPR